MFEVKHFDKNCSRSRNVAFLLDTGSPYTIISPALKTLILADCNIPNTAGKHERFPITINGKDIMPKIAIDHYANTNIIGMDFMKENNV